jgi:hypothetical protein
MQAGSFPANCCPNVCVSRLCSRMCTMLQHQATPEHVNKATAPAVALGHPGTTAAAMQHPSVQQDPQLPTQTYQQSPRTLLRELRQHTPTQLLLLTPPLALLLPGLLLLLPQLCAAYCRPSLTIS